MRVGAFDVPVDTYAARERAVAIAKAGQESSQAMLAKYQQLATTTNDKGDRSCANIRDILPGRQPARGLWADPFRQRGLMQIWIVDGAAS
jgi:hypothetical protein